jgi:hypothetical protein
MINLASILAIAHERFVFTGMLSLDLVIVCWALYGELYWTPPYPL